jgi:hypothetical protein
MLIPLPEGRSISPVGHTDASNRLPQLFAIDRTVRSALTPEMSSGLRTGASHKLIRHRSHDNHAGPVDQPQPRVPFSHETYGFRRTGRMRTDNKIAPNPRQRPRCRPRSRQRSRKTAGTAANHELLHAVEQPGKLTQTVETVKRAGRLRIPQSGELGAPDTIPLHPQTAGRNPASS